MVLLEGNNKIINFLKLEVFWLLFCIYYIFYDLFVNYYCYINFEVIDYNKFKGWYFYLINFRVKLLFCISLIIVKGKVDMYYVFKMNWNF